MLYQNYGATYQPQYQQAQSQAQGSPFSSQRDASDQNQAAPPQAGANPSQQMSSGAPNGQSYQGASPASPPSAASALATNLNPAMTSPWTNPTSTQWAPGQSGSGFGLWKNPGSPALYQTNWANPFQSVSDTLYQADGNSFNYGNGMNSIHGGGMVTPGSGQNIPGSQQSTVGGLDVSGAPQSLGTMEGNLMQGYNSSQQINGNAIPQAQLQPWQANQLFSAATPDQLSSINPYALQSSFSTAAQNYSNAFANPNFNGGDSSIQGTSNPGAVPTGNGQTQQGYAYWMNQAFNNYTAQMNQDHLF